ncbi:MAG: hypothetical protein M1829_003812 [Trizodia sp. TS-e1964]|nr:MAG: hypothetical protein M1829_003812 [Trizodia sp. TS-e1964]
MPAPLTRGHEDVQFIAKLNRMAFCERYQSSDTIYDDVYSCHPPDLSKRDFPLLPMVNSQLPSTPSQESFIAMFPSTSADSLVLSELDALGFLYLQEAGAVICAVCELKDRRIFCGDGPLQHAKLQHGEVISRRVFFRLADQLPVYHDEYSNVPQRRALLPAIPSLPISKGFACIFCYHATTSERTMATHIKTSHTGLSPENAPWYQRANVQLYARVANLATHFAVLC